MNGGVTVRDMEQRKIDARDVSILRAQVAQLRQALKLAINTVECASLDNDLVTELPWYANAKMALRETEAAKDQE